MMLVSRDTTIYAMVVAILVTLSLGSYLIFDSIVSQQQHLATVINISGRQRMLSQRITLLSQQLAHAQSAAAREDLGGRLRESIDLMRRSHRDLVDGSMTLGIDPPAAPALHEIYFGPEHDLNHRVATFLDLGDHLLESQQQDDQTQIVVSSDALAAQSDGLLVELDTAVNHYVGESERVFRQSQFRVFCITAAMMTALGTEALFIFTPLFRRIKTLLSLAQSDPLTRCLNRRSLMDRLAGDFALARRGHRPLSVIMLDLDHFKKINDSHGPAVGDAILLSLVEVVKASIRTSDIFGRVGGEEFLVILPDTGLDNALLVAEKIRAQLAATQVVFDQKQLTFTASFGAARITDHDTEPFALIERAETALDTAKKGGRNRVIGSGVGISHP